MFFAGRRKNAVMKKNLAPGTPAADRRYRVVVSENGPYLVYGHPPVRQNYVETDPLHIPWVYRQGRKNYCLETEPTALCRCGRSDNKPYCDGSHDNAPWDPTLTASHASRREGADVIEGPALTLVDNERYCSYSRFCDAKERVWNLVLMSDDSQKREDAIHEAERCPSGRLQVWDNATGRPVELAFEPSIGIIRDTPLGVEGPLWIKGGIPVAESNGEAYETHNRMTLCTCGCSSNKPFCNGAHAAVHFRNGLPYEPGEEEI